jgi:putative ABC transport system permease protein
MHIKHVLKTASTSLKTNKSRTGLTILGIVIGVMAIILVVSVGKGAEQMILSQVQAFGSTNISVEPGREPTGPSDFAEMFSDSLKVKDLEALRNPSNVQGVKNVVPIIMQNETVLYEGETYRSSIIGSNKDLAGIFDIYPEKGVLFGDSDVKSRASVAVIGANVERELFGFSDSLGKKIKIKGRPFRIVGVMSSTGQMSFFNVDKMVLIPYTTAQKYLFGINHFHSLIVQAENEEVIPRVEEEIKLTLRELHGITDPSKDDFRVETQESAAERVGSITGILTALLVSVAAVALLVGGVGIMNIMLVSVTERTREIGLRKALGATKTDILKQFLLESVILTLVGGIIGILVGAFLSLLAAIVLSSVVNMDWNFVFSFPAALIGIGVSVFVGLVFGIYPAKEAAKKSPIEALRYE